MTVVAYNLFSRVEILSARLYRLAERPLAEHPRESVTVDSASRSTTLTTDSADGRVAVDRQQTEAEEVDRGNLLMARLQSGDERVLDELFALYNGRLYAFLRRIVRDSETTEDILQETWLAVYENRDRYEKSYRFSTWLFTIARRKALSELRRRKVRSIIRPSRLQGSDRDEIDLLEVPQQTYHNPEAVAAGGVVGPIIERVLGRLTSAQREIITLRDIEGLDNEEVAEILGWQLKPGAIRKRIFDARAAFRRECERIGFDAAGEY